MTSRNRDEGSIGAAASVFGFGLHFRDAFYFKIGFTHFDFF